MKEAFFVAFFALRGHHSYYCPFLFMYDVLTSLSHGTDIYKS